MADDTLPGTRRASAIALIDEGNALQEQGRNRGNVLLAEARIDEARSAYERAIACDSQYAGAHFNLGNLHCRAGEYERALRDYQTAIAIKPDFAGAFVAMGNTLDSLGRGAEAIESYERASALDPGNAGVCFNLGLSALAQGEGECALDSLRRATGIRPDYVEAHHVLGRVLAGRGDFEAAAASLSRAASIAPDSAAIARDRAMVFHALGRFPEALQEAMRNLDLASLTWEDKLVFANCVAPAKFTRSDPRIRAALRAARTLPFAPFTPMADDSQPQVLIAGCGTGSQPILMTQRCRGVRVLAVDLSLSSISYAMRKTREFGLTNIEYAQADILKLGELTRTFDIVAAVGVLHHLADPFLGWRTLLTRVRPGGFMHLGFYSQIARRHVIKAREFIAARGYEGTVDDIRRFRREFAARGAGAELQWLSRVPDFFSTSECRDLLFHVQEHRLTLGEIGAFLSESGLRFLGFELDAHVLHRYRSRFTDDPTAVDLHNWERFEADNPDTFIGMYQFWVQKPAA